MRDLARWHERIRLREVGAGATPGNVIRHNDESPRAARLAAEVAGEVDHLSLAQAEVDDVVAVHQHDAPLADEAAMPVLQPVDGRVVLIVAAHRHHEQLSWGELRARKRVHREPRLAGRRAEPALARAVGEVEPARPANPLVVPLRARHDLRYEIADAIVVLDEPRPTHPAARADRPRQGRIRPVSPATRCARLSLVETCTVSLARRSAPAVYSVSGAAERKFPPRAKKIFALPSWSAWMAPTVSRPWWRGARMPVAFSSASRKAGVGFSQIPIVRSPCTLLWPRTGHTPAPVLPIAPRRSRTLTTSRMLSTAFSCCVRPIAQQKMMSSFSMRKREAARICSSAMPLPRTISGQPKAARFSV